MAARAAQALVKRKRGGSGKSSSSSSVASSKGKGTRTSKSVPREKDIVEKEGHAMMKESAHAANTEMIQGSGMTPRRGRESKARTIIITLTMLSLGCGALLVFLMLARHDPTEIVICKTADCLRHATELKESMDMSVNPCDDFYKFTCGSWKPKHKERSMVARVFDQTTDIAMKEMEGPSDKAVVPKALDYFKTCIQRRDLSSADVRIFMDFKQHLGFYWPEKVQPAVDALFSLLNLTINWNLNLLFSLRAQPAYKHRPQTLYIGRGNLAIWALDPMWTPETFAEVVRQHCSLLGAETPPASSVEELLNTTKDIVGATLKIMPEATSDTEFTLQEIELLMPKRADDWLSSLNKLHSPQYTWTLHSTVVLEDEEILQNMQTLLHKYDERKRALMEGIAFVLVRFTLWLVVGKPELRFGPDPVVGRYIWKRTCLSYTALHFGLLVAAKHIYARYTSSVRGELDIFYKTIQETIKQQLEDADWIEATVKIKATAKIDELMLDAVPEDLFFSEVDLARLYREFPTIQSSVVSNLISVASAYRLLIGHDSFIRIYSKQLIDDNKPNRYDYYYNVARILLGAMEPPILYLNGTMGMMHGSFGTLIAECLVRSFDKHGVHVDDRGSKDLWWDSPAYAERVGCDILSDKSRRSDTAPGVDTQPPARRRDPREARLSALFPLAPALNVSFTAYRKALVRDGHTHEEWRLHGLDYNDDQVFFLTYCLMTCAINSTGESCNVPLRQMQKFASTFGCKTNSPMNPKKKCTFL
ncbi:hypothetical protein HPB50_002725 [Hyalomma asiaticum]|uniref:Uncharacterized protein n=1 Tax=Hyalomma asiaticum TaxID=266040 RepID=A0ACB7SEA8_HYAAI|nr:hypothetical protein HPB50_002725 [Hyalomma asiaticum]